MAEERASAVEILRASERPGWPAALALVQEMVRAAEAAGWPVRLSAFRLGADGQVFVEPEPGEAAGLEPAQASLHLDSVAGTAAAIRSLAELLQPSLPAPGTAAVEPRVPAALRYTLIRALGEVTAPPFHSVAEFSQALARFEQGDRRQLLAPLVRGKASTPRDERPTERARRWDELPLVQDAPPRAKRRTAGPLLTAAAVLSIFAAAIVVAAAVLVTTTDSRRFPLLDAIGPSLARLRDFAVESVTGRAARGENETRGTAGSGASGTGEAAKGGDRPAGNGESREASGVPAAAAPPPGGGSASAPPVVAPSPPALPPAAAAGPVRPGELVEAVDVGNRPVFSPSFAAGGSAIFLDPSGPADAAPLEGAGARDDGRVVHVLSVLDDRARNYHPRLSPDGSQVAFDSDRDGVRGVYLSDRSGHGIRRVSGEGYAAVPSWSPDGERLAFIKAEAGQPRVWNVWVLDLATGFARRLTSHAAGQPWGASWFPDGRRICYAHDDRLVVLDTASGASRIYPSPRKGALVRTPVVAPDGRRIVFQLDRDGAWLLDLGDGSMRRVLDDPTAEEFAWSPDGSRLAFHSRRDRQWGIWTFR